MLQWIRKHRKALAGISVGAGAFFAAISFITYKVMAAEETTASGNNLINIGISTSDGNDMASVLQMLLVLTVISLAPSILIIIYKNCNCVAFYEGRAWNTDSTT